MWLVLPYEMNLTELLKENTIFLSHRNTETVKGDKKPGNIFGEDGRTRPLDQTCLPLPHSLQEEIKHSSRVLSDIFHRLGEIPLPHSLQATSRLSGFVK